MTEISKQDVLHAYPVFLFLAVIKNNENDIENMTKRAYNKGKQGVVSMKGAKNGGKYN